MIRAGDIGIESAGENGRQEFSDIYDPVSVQTTIYREMEAVREPGQDRLGQRRSWSGRPQPPRSRRPSPSSRSSSRSRSSTSSVIGGALTDAEFEAHKAKLLEGLTQRLR